jgi:hypothetical protein
MLILLLRIIIKSRVIIEEIATITNMKIFQFHYQFLVNISLTETAPILNISRSLPTATLAP